MAKVINNVMTQKEAIERIKTRFVKWALDDEDLIALQALGLVGVESEDERIRKRIISYLKQDIEEYPERKERIDEMLAYLEKQKDSDKAMSAIEKIDKYIDVHTANAHDMDDSNPDKKYYQGRDDALGKIAGILQDVYSDEKQKFNIEKLREISTPAEENWFETQKEGEKEDDEMVRKIITDSVFCQYGAGAEYKDVLDYLDRVEKQKEPKWSPSEGEMGVLYKLCYTSNQITDEDDTELTRLYQDLKREYFNGRSFENMFSNEKQEEQKPTEEEILAKLPDYTPANLSPHIEQSQEWSEEDEKMRNEIITIMDGGKVTSGTYLFEYAAWLKSLPERFNLQPKQEWGEEDEKMMRYVIGSIDTNISDSNFKKIRIWFESIKDRVQPKQECEDIINEVASILINDENRADNKVEEDRLAYLAEKIQSLRPQPHWKPSEEQMDALETAASSLQSTALASLYNDLMFYE